MRKVNFNSFGRLLFTIFLGGMLISAQIVYSQETGDPSVQTDEEKFIENLNYAIQDPVARQDIFTSLKGKRTLLKWFLGDMIAVMEDFQKQDVRNPDLQPAEDFVRKWSSLPANCPYCDIFQPFLNSILQEFAHNISLDQRLNPLARLQFAFDTWNHTNPFGLSAFFRRLPVAEKQTNLVVHEKSKTFFKPRKGEEVFIKERSVIKKVNGITVFHEVIRDDHLQDFSLVRTEVNSIRGLLDELYNNKDVKPTAVALVDHYLQLIEQQVQVAWEQGYLDDNTYSYLTEPQNRNLDWIPSKHPLLKPPFLSNYKVLKFYQKKG